MVIQRMKKSNNKSCKVYNFMDAYKKKQKQIEARLVKKIIDSVKHLNYLNSDLKDKKD